jgi:hypothetical protein
MADDEPGCTADSERSLQPFQLQSFIGIVILMACIGLPISWGAGKYHAGTTSVSEKV